MPFAKARGGNIMSETNHLTFHAAQQDSYAVKVAEILDEKLKKAGVDPADHLSDEELGLIEELTKEAQDEAKKALGIEA